MRRLWNKVRVLGLDECWEWTGSKSLSGYGRHSFRGKVWYAHRLAYWFTRGVIPGELDVRHSCDNPACCNPTHLILGTHQDNMMDRAIRIRGFHKLKPQEILSIRKDPRTQCELAKIYGTSQQYISRIQRVKVWKHLKEEN